MEQPEPFDQRLRIGGEDGGDAAAMSAVPWQLPEPIPCPHPARHSRTARYGDPRFSAFIASMSQPGSLTPPSGFPAYHPQTKGFPDTAPMLCKDGDTATFDALPTNGPDNMANRFDPGHLRTPLQAGNNPERDAPLQGEITRKPLTPPGVLPVTPPMSDPAGVPDLGQGPYADPVAPSGSVILPLRVDATDSPLPYASATSSAELAQDHAPFPYLKPANGFSFPSGTAYPMSAEYTVASPAQELQSADGFPTPLPYASASRPLGLDAPSSFGWPELARTLSDESTAFAANRDRLPSVSAFYNADPFPPHDYPSGKEVGTLDDTTNPNSLPEAASAEAGENVPAKPFTLTAKDFTVAFGRTHTEDELTDQEVANDFARAWAEDPEAIKYDGMYYAEAEAPPDKDSRAASGWLPTAPETEPFPTMVPFAPLARSHAYEEDENELFEAYGASYAEAYAVALSLEFSEVKPVPDDNTGDVTGLASSILHTPSGEPILLGTMMLESDGDNAADKREPVRVAENLDTASEPPLSVGRKIVRYALLALGAAAVVVSGLYFAGLLL